MGEQKPDPMDVPKVLECLNVALVLQQRSVLQFTMGAGSMFGLEYQAVGSELWLFARRARRHEAAGGEDHRARRRPDRRGRELRWKSDPGEAVDAMIEAEDETSRRCTPSSPTRPGAALEALEHLMEHLIMRKQNQVDWLRRARREP